LGDLQLGTRNSEPRTLEYWCFVPNAVDLLPENNTADRRLESFFRVFRAFRGSQSPNPRTRIIYYCADDWTQFHNLDGEWMAAKEQELIARADAVFVTSRFLERKLDCEQKVTKIIYMPHGVEYDRFAMALDKTQPVPDDVAGLPKPVIGFYGNLHPWVDFDRVASLAIARPAYSFVLIGEPYVDVAALEASPNVYLLGRREHGVLHDYCRAFDVAIIPYDMSNPRMESVNPVKTKELLAAGVPVVASDVPELRNYGDNVITCTTPYEWLAALDRQVARTDHVAISESVSEESWENKVEAIRGIVDTSSTFRVSRVLDM
jgi:glycosyltransferase involved in cell wall biosynthesis